MKLNKRCLESIDESVLCWLASVGADGTPNVTPKQIFTHHENTLLIANIASANTVENIQANPKICVSMIEIFAMRGFKYTGMAKYFDTDCPEYQVLAPKLVAIAGSDFAVLGVTWRYSGGNSAYRSDYVPIMAIVSRTNDCRAQSENDERRLWR